MSMRKKPVDKMITLGPFSYCLGMHDRRVGLCYAAETQSLLF